MARSNLCFAKGKERHNGTWCRWLGLNMKAAPKQNRRHSHATQSCQISFCGLREGEAKAMNIAILSTDQLSLPSRIWKKLLPDPRAGGSEMSPAETAGDSAKFVHSDGAQFRHAQLYTAPPANNKPGEAWGACGRIRHPMHSFLTVCTRQLAYSFTRKRHKPMRHSPPSKGLCASRPLQPTCSIGRD